MRNQAVRVNGGYRGQVTANGRLVAETIRVFNNRNQAVIDAWLILLDIRESLGLTL